MAEVVDVYDKIDFVLVVYSGEFTVDAANRAVDRALRACDEYGRQAILVDCSDMTGPLSIMDRYQVAEHGQRLQGRVSKVAIVRPKDSAPPDKFMETAAANRRVNLKLFDGFEEAVDWLKA